MPASLPPNRLSIDVQPHDGGVVMRLAGELDAATAEQFERSLGSLPAPCPVLVLDLHELGFVDSIGLNMLFRAREWAQSTGVALRVVRASVHVQRLLALAAMDGTLGPFYANVAAALRG